VWGGNKTEKGEQTPRNNSKKNTGGISKDRYRVEVLVQTPGGMNGKRITIGKEREQSEGFAGGGNYKFTKNHRKKPTLVERRKNSQDAHQTTQSSVAEVRVKGLVAVVQEGRT